MSGKVRQRAAANTADSATLSTNEKILKECHTLYTDPDNGKDIFISFYYIVLLLQFGMKVGCQTSGKVQG